jgi:NAD(P)H-dependent FMN reductase
MKIVVISGSMRKESQSLKVSNWLAQHVGTLGLDSQVVDLHELKLPIYDDGETEAPMATKLLSDLETADAAVFVSPEWNGMMSHGLMNMQHYVEKQLAHKPIMLVGVSSGRNGHYPLAQMRQIGYKNNQYVISPEALLVQGVNNMLNDHDMNEEDSDYSVKKRADYALKVLVEYAKALAFVRSSGVVDYDSFKNGV